MSSVVRVRSDMKQFQHAMKEQPKLLRKAQSMALNKTMPKVMTSARRDASSATGIQQKVIRPRFRFKGRLKATADRLEAVIILDARPIPAHHIGAARQNRSGVKVGKKQFPGAFLAPAMGSSKTMVFERYGQPRKMTAGNYVGQRKQPIRRIGVSIEKEAEAATRKALNTIGVLEYPRELERAINLQLSRLKK